MAYVKWRKGHRAVNRDIREILDSWEFDPEKVNARWIEGEDGKRKIQLRLDLGVLQMEMTGRPDGKRPEGYASLVHKYRAIEKKSDFEIPDIKLGAKECMLLQKNYLCKKM